MCSSSVCFRSDSAQTKINLAYIKLKFIFIVFACFDKMLCEVPMRQNTHTVKP